MLWHRAEQAAPGRVGTLDPNPRATTTASPTVCEQGVRSRVSRAAGPSQSRSRSLAAKPDPAPLSDVVRRRSADPSLGRRGRAIRVPERERNRGYRRSPSVTRTVLDVDQGKARSRQLAAPALPKLTILSIGLYWLNGARDP
jgi:hypothetical protein